MDKEKYLRAKGLANEIRGLESSVMCLNGHIESENPGLDWAYDIGPNDMPAELKRQLLHDTLKHIKAMLSQAQKEFEAL